MKNSHILKEGLERISLSLNEKQIQQFIKYYELLIEWNKVMNLTAITEYEEVVNKHFIDSLSIIRAVQLNQSLRVLDLGTGAGFPGIPLKIVFPEIEMTLLDSLNKRIKFLNTVIENLELTKITALHGRAEDYAKRLEYREQFDMCVSRAVANLSTLSEYCMPYVKVGGKFISYKSGKIIEELETSKNAIKILGGEINKVDNFTLPMTDIERSFIILDKVKKTPNIYPRTAGKPSKEPIQ